MEKIPTLSIGLAAPGHATAGTTPAFSIEVTHLATQIVDPSESVSLHTLSQGVTLLLPEQGTIDLNVDDTSFRLVPGQVLAVDGSSQFGVLRPDASGPEPRSQSRIHVIECNARIGDTFSLRELIDLPILMDAEAADAFGRFFEQLTFGESPIPLLPGGVDLSRHLTAVNLVAMLLKTATVEPAMRLAGARDEQVPSLRQFLLENMNRNVGVPEMARHLNMSRTAFFRWAKRELGCPPLKYLRTMRLERSQEWIAQDAGSLDEIASQTGFSDCSHLGREFKKHFGMTPAQYRRTARSSQQADFLARAAERYFSQGRFQEALATCEQGLKSNAPPSVHDRIHYQKGLCLRALGRGKEAISEWRSLRATGLSHRAGMQECKQVFQQGDHTRAQELIRVLYTNANERQKQELIFLWMDQARDLVAAKRPQPLRKYLTLRGDLFPHNMHSIGHAVNALRMLGDDLEILEQCRELPTACYNALRRAGRYDEAVQRYGPDLSPSTIARGAYLQGRYEDVLAIEQTDPGRTVAALVALGRSEEAIELYPRHSAPAYLALGRHKELLERLPSMDVGVESRIAALHCLGRTQEADALMTDGAGGWIWSGALVCVHPDAALASNHPDAAGNANGARLLLTLNALLEGDDIQAEATLEQIDGIRSRDLWWYDHHGTELLISALLRGFLGRPDHLRDDLAEIVANHKYKDKQALWHDAAYLNGRITAAEYRAQPQQIRTEERLAFVRAVANDLKGDGAPARKEYGSIASAGTILEPSELIRRRFATWRLQEL